MKIKLFIIIFILSLPCIGSAKQKNIIENSFFHPLEDASITIYRPDLNERETFVYRDARGQINQAAMEGIAKIFRCKLTGEVHPIDIELIEILDQIEHHFGIGEIKLISPYRSPLRNALMKKQGRGVAKNSLHMFGKAADIEIAGVSTTQIRDYAYSLHKGGVGFYGKNTFVHVDSGSLRTWGWKAPATTKNGLAKKQNLHVKKS